MIKTTTFKEKIHVILHIFGHYNNIPSISIKIIDSIIKEERG